MLATPGLRACPLERGAFMPGRSRAGLWGPRPRSWSPMIAPDFSLPGLKVLRDHECQVCLFEAGRLIWPCYLVCLSPWPPGGCRELAFSHSGTARNRSHGINAAFMHSGVQEIARWPDPRGGRFGMASSWTGTRAKRGVTVHDRCRRPAGHLNCHGSPPDQAAAPARITGCQNPRYQGCGDTRSRAP